MIRTTRRASCTAVLAAGALLGLSATPALAADAPRASGTRAPVRLGVRLGDPTCVHVGVLNTVRVNVRLGSGGCGRQAPPSPPRPPSPRPPTPKPPAPRPPSPPKPPRPAPADSARPAAFSAARSPVPPRARAVPPAERPAPPSATPGRRAAMPRAATLPPRRKNPLSTLMVLVVITAVIAAGAGVAFAAAP
jgi:outer membrane biosynthesis protein TonB